MESSGVESNAILHRFMPAFEHFEQFLLPPAFRVLMIAIDVHCRVPGESAMTRIKDAEAFSSAPLSLFDPCGIALPS